MDKRLQSTHEIDGGPNSQDAIRRAQSNPAEFGLVYESYFDRVFSYALARCQRRDESEDLTAEIFVAALRGLNRYRGGSFSAWLFRVARNRLLNFERDEAKRRYAQLPPDLAAPTDFTEAVQAKEVVWSLIPKLSRKQQEAITLKFAADLTTGEVAEVMGMNSPAVKMLLVRGLRRLRELAEEGEVADGDRK